jgi:hypothetical protein
VGIRRVLELVTAHVGRRRRIAKAAALEVGKLWSDVDRSNIARSWQQALPEAVAAVARAQVVAAAESGPYLDQLLEEYGLPAVGEARVNIAGLAAIASDGRPLDSLIYHPAISALQTIQAGGSVDQALATGAFSADLITRTQVADAGRVADGVNVAADRNLQGYIRMLTLPSCSRCIILAGKFYAWNAGFERHPACDCVHVPSTEDNLEDLRTNPSKLFESLSEAEQNKIFTIAGAQAIRDGADMNQVVNVRRGAAGLNAAGGRATPAEVRVLRGGRGIGRLQATKVAGQDVLISTEGTTRRGLAGRRLNGRARLMPEQIYKIAGDDRDEALRLLYRNGYLLQPPESTPRLRKVAPAKAAPVKAAPVKRPEVAPAAPPREPEPQPIVKAEPVTQAHVAVRGQDRLAELVAQVEANPLTSAQLGARNREARFDVALAELAAKQGFDGLPQIGTAAELDDAVASGWTEVWRGVQGSSQSTAAAINSRLRTGAYEPGRGLYGNGWYTSVRRITAENYRGREPKTNFPAGGGADFELSDLDGPQEPDSMVRFAISPQARVVEYDELKSLRDKWLAGQAGKNPELRAYFSDLGRFASALGYDAFRVPGSAGGDGGYYPGWEEADDPGGADQFVILNRTAVLIQRAEDVP